ncbi:MAG: type II toxin-antitoxin system PemK/MazF family toxin [Candidatus Uhrbacteria bacterium]
MDHVVFDEWNEEKQRIDGKTHKPPYVSVGDIWWMSIGRNVGAEIYGKNSTFARPAVILKKLTYDFYLVAPTSTTVRTGTWYVPIKQNGVSMTVCLNQIRTMDYRRLQSKLGSIDDEENRRIRAGFLNVYAKQ